MSLRSAEGDPGASRSMRISHLRAAFAIRWAPSPVEGEVHSVHVAGRHAETFLRVTVEARTLRPAYPDEALVVQTDVMNAWLDFDFDRYTPVDEPDPLCLVAVEIEPEVPIENVLTFRDDDTLDAGDGDGIYRLTDEILHLATVGLNELSGAMAVGPLANGDLVGHGTLRLSDGNGLDAEVPIPRHPQLGSWQSPNESLGAGVFALDHLHSGRRLLRWSARADLRWTRGEWAEAVVAREAALEAKMWTTLDALLMDHGWTSTELTGRDLTGKIGNAIQLRAALQSHLGGNWEPAGAALDELWKLRNRSLHRSEEMSGEHVARADELARVVGDLISERLSTPTIAKRHPLTASLYSQDSPKTLGRQLYAQIEGKVPLVALSDLRQLNDTVHPGMPRRTTTPRECPTDRPPLWSS